jgi:hypothetical protein
MEIRKLHQYSKISLSAFLIVQLRGIYILFKGDSSLTSQLNLSNLAKDATSGNLNTLGLPSVKFTSVESFLSGAAISMTSGFWLAVAWSGSLVINTLKSGVKSPYLHHPYYKSLRGIVCTLIT